MRHLGIEDVNCIHVMDLEASRWITHLKTSPAINIASNAMIHVKKKDVEVAAKEVLEVATSKVNCIEALSGFRTPEKRKTAEEHLENNVIDLTELLETPTGKKMRLTKREDRSTSTIPLSPSSERPLQATHMESEGFEIIGTRPAKLSRFPAKTVHEMTTRLDWIVSNKTGGTVEQRFAKVFSCDFKVSTYHRHRKAWKHMMDTSMLTNKAGTDLWGPNVQAAEAAMKEMSTKDT